jgi:hypothetical protein
MDKQLKTLVELAEIDDPILKKATLAALLNRKIETPVARLAELLSHPCNKEQIDLIKRSFKQQYYSETVQADPDIQEILLESKSRNLAGIIGTGTLSQGIYLNDGTPDPRVECFKNLAGKSANESDAFKGSQQGLGRKKRKTRKSSKKLRKTMRRK